MEVSLEGTEFRQKSYQQPETRLTKAPAGTYCSRSPPLVLAYLSTPVSFQSGDLFTSVPFLDSPLKNMSSKPKKGSDPINELIEVPVL